MSALAPSTPIGFPSITNLDSPSFSNTPAQMVTQAIELMELWATIRTFSKRW